MPEAAKQSIDSIKTWFKVMAFCAFVALVAIVVIGKIWLDASRSSDARNLAHTRQEACFQSNRDQTRNRIFVHQQLFEFAKLGGNQVDESTLTDDQRAKIADYDAFAAEQFPYRKCSAECVTAYLDKSIPDCPPSSNEEGT